MQSYNRERLRLPTEVTVQCPQCGANKARTTSSLRNRETGKEVPSRAAFSTQQSLMILVIVGGVVVLISNAILGPDFGFVSGLLGCLIGGATLFGLVYYFTQREIAAVRVHHYHCMRCGNEWDWQEGKPVPMYRGRDLVEEDYRAVFGGDEDDAADASR